MSSPPTPSVCPLPAVRYHALDALRASALLLGVFFHATLAYIPGSGVGWAVQDTSTHALMAVAAFVIHSFRLGIFFLLAGFFGRLLLISRGISSFLGNRIQRLALPFILGWLLVYPGLAFSWIWGAMKGDTRLFSTALKVGYGETWNQMLRVARGEFIQTFPLSHLWFLYLLLLLCLVFLALRLLLKIGLRRFRNAEHAADRSFVKLFESAWLLPVLVVLSTPLLFGMKHWGIDTPDKSFIPILPVSVLYGGMFGLGWLLHRHASMLDFLKRKAWRHASLALLCFIPAIALAGFEVRSQVPHMGIIIAVHHLAYAGMMWSLIFASLGMFLRFVDTESRMWRYLSDSSYWVYILHLPLVTALQVYLSRSDYSCWIKVALCTLVPLGLCLITYHLLVRSTPVGLLLNGKRYAFRSVPKM